MEEAVYKPVTLSELKEGDEVTVTHSGTVSSVNEYTGHVRLKNGARVRLTYGKGVDRVGNEAIIYTATRKEQPLPDFKAGQVWVDTEGTQYHVLNGVTLKAWTTKEKMVLIADLAKKPGLKMVFAGVNES